MRASVPDLISPHPLGIAMPGVYHDDPVIQAFLTAFDEVLAPILCTLDNLDAYLDPRLTPPDFLEWLGGWVGMVLDENWPLERRRLLVERAVELYRWRGTVKGLAAHVALHTGVEPEIEESGGLTWSSRPGQRVPGTADSFVRVRVRVPDPSAINAERLSVMIGNALPADIIHELVVEQLVDDAGVTEAPVAEPQVEDAPVGEATEVVEEAPVADGPVAEATEVAGEAAPPVEPEAVVDETPTAEAEPTADEEQAGDEE